MICVVAGFNSRVSALQFEYAWQHPHKTRSLASTKRVVEKSHQLYGNLNRYFGVLRQLTTCDEFAGIPSLSVYLVEKDALECWNSNKYHIETNVEVIYDAPIALEQADIVEQIVKEELNGKVDSNGKVKQNDKIKQNDEVKQAKRSRSTNVTIGGGLLMKELQYLEENPPSKSSYFKKSRELLKGIEGLHGVCPECYHTDLLTKFARSNPTMSTTFCPKCRESIKWNVIVRNACMVQEVGRRDDSRTEEPTPETNQN